jgi:DNA polymerase-3 subunit delta
MIIFLYGPDTYRSRQKLNEIVASYKKTHKSGLNLKYFNFENADFQKLIDEIQSVSMFAEKKLLILKNTINNKDFKENFLKNAKRFLSPDYTILLYEGGRVPENEPLFEFLKKYGKHQEFELLGSQRLRSWVKKEFGSYGVKIKAGALEKLIIFVGNDLWQMENEIKKLVSYENKKIILEEDIELLVKPKIESDIFKTIDSIALRNRQQALKLIHKQLEGGDSSSYLFSMINFQFRSMIEIKDMVEKNKPYSIILRESGLHPFVVKKSYNLARKFTLDELKKIYRKIFQVELNIKTGRLNPQAGLDLLIAEI